MSRKDVSYWICDLCAKSVESTSTAVPKGWVQLRPMAPAAIYNADFCSDCALLFLAFMHRGGTGAPKTV